MNFIADLHIHSRFSRATSRQLTTHSLAAWAMLKGIHVLGTGDFTHPGWREELRDTLVRDETSGLYRLKDAPALSLALPGLEPDAAAVHPPPLFLPQAEISSIYKRHGKVRKVHNLVYMPDLESAERLSRRLEGIGNLASDGRPILGLDSRDLLEMVLEADPRGALVPAHAWTPWFAVFGSKSGFNSMEECFGDLTPHIFALETGLSSDPAMNRLWSHLDRYTLISNSDAHSGANLGREANLFTGPPNYDGIFAALRREEGSCAYAGTVEFFPEEGKYHLDGHRACHVVLEPREALALRNICPVCGKPLTIGVLHRVLELADRETPPENLPEPGFVSMIPLPELLGELLGVGAQSRKVAQRYAQLVETLGPELEILRSLPEDDLRRHWEGLGEGIARMRRGEVIRQSGYDGEYGTVRVFTPQEAASLRAGKARAALPGLPALHTAARKESPSSPPPHTLLPPRCAHDTTATPQGDAAAPDATAISETDTEPPPEILAQHSYSTEQTFAMTAGPGPVLVMAGPGAGKTHTLLGRIAHLRNNGVPSQEILVVTFTRRAAEELRQRLRSLGGLTPENDALAGPDLPRCDTLHALAWAELQRVGGPSLLLSEESARRIFGQSNGDRSVKEIRAAWDALALARETCAPLSPALRECLERYRRAKARWRAVDYTDLLELWLERLAGETAPARPASAASAPKDLLSLLSPPAPPSAAAVAASPLSEQGTAHPWTHVLVDEVQDLSPLQWAVLLHLLPNATKAEAAGRGFFGIGDPDQAIYGFRGAQPHVREFLAARWPQLQVFSLTRSYRGAPEILACASAVMAGHSACGPLRAHRQAQARLHLFEAPSATAEARWVAENIAALLGGASHTLADAAALEAAHTRQLPDTLLSPGDVAVLVRTRAQMPALRQALEQQGVPCAVPEQEGFWHDPRVARILEEAARALGEPAAQKAESQPPAAQGARPFWPPTPQAVWDDGTAGLRAHLITRGAPPADGQPAYDALFWASTAWKALENLWGAHGTWPAVLAEAHLLRDVEMVRARAERVQIMTLHAAKGLEFRAVFLPGLEDGLLPLHRQALRKAAGVADDAEAIPFMAGEAAPDETLAEERRLFYVGLTRAADMLFLSHARQRFWQGATIQLPPSPLLEAVRPHCRSTALRAHTRSSAQQLTLL